MAVKPKICRSSIRLGWMAAALATGVYIDQLMAAPALLQCTQGHYLDVVLDTCLPCSVPCGDPDTLYTLCLQYCNDMFMELTGLNLTDTVVPTSREPEMPTASESFAIPGWAILIGSFFLVACAILLWCVIVAIMSKNRAHTGPVYETGSGLPQTPWFCLKKASSGAVTVIKQGTVQPGQRRVRIVRRKVNADGTKVPIIVQTTGGSTRRSSLKVTPRTSPERTTILMEPGAPSCRPGAQVRFAQCDDDVDDDDDQVPSPTSSQSKDSTDPELSITVNPMCQQEDQIKHANQNSFKEIAKRKVSFDESDPQILGEEDCYRSDEEDHPDCDLQEVVCVKPGETNSRSGQAHETHNGPSRPPPDIEDTANGCDVDSSSNFAQTNCPRPKIEQEEVKSGEHSPLLDHQSQVS